MPTATRRRATFTLRSNPLSDITTILPQYHDESDLGGQPEASEAPIPGRLFAAIGVCLIGAVSIVIGVGMIYLPAGFIVGGVIAVGVAATLLNVSEPEEQS